MSFIPRILSRNWQLKASAFAMAVLLWTVPRFQAQNTQVLDDIPIRVQQNDPNWVLTEEPSPPVVSVTLSGPGRDLIALGVERPPLSIPITEVISGDTTVSLLQSWFRASGREVVVEDIRPAFVRLSFERIEEKRVEFSIPLFGDLPQGVSLSGPPEIEPPGARIYGAASRLDGLDVLQLTPFDLSRVAEDGPFLLSVDTTGLQDLDIVPLRATVALPLEPTVAREFPGKTIGLPRLDTDPQLQTRQTAVTIVLMGARSLVEAVDPESLSVTIPSGQATLAPGQEVRVMLVVEGVPEFVEPRAIPDWVVLRRPAGQ